MWRADDDLMGFAFDAAAGGAQHCLAQRRPALLRIMAMEELSLRSTKAPALPLFFAQVLLQCWHACCCCCWCLLLEQRECVTTQNVAGEE